MEKSLAFLIVLSLTTTASAECLSLRQARREYPNEYLSWRGHHCWFAPNARHKKHKHKEHERKHEATPLPVPDTPVTETEPTPSPVIVQPELTPDALIRHGVTHMPKQAPEVLPERTEQVPPRKEPEVKRAPERKRIPVAAYLLIVPLIASVLLVLGSFRRFPFSKWMT